MQEPGRARGLLLLGSVFVVAAAGLVYELIAGTLTTYLLGGSVLVFSIVIGLFLSAMGLGAWLAQYVRFELARAFVLAELVLGLVGGLSALGLFAAFASSESYKLALLLVSVVIGALVGLEIPLLLRILEKKVEVRVAVSHVLALDYVGALVGSVLFPLLLLPHLGLVRSSALLGLMNVAVAFLALAVLGREIARRKRLVAFGGVVGAILSAVLIGGGQATTWLEDRLYSDPVVLARSSSYQRVVVTRWRDDVRLYLDGHLQFSSADEYRYHEALIHPAMAAAKHPAQVLILGGGDGLAIREVLRWEEVRRVVLVDLDPAVTELFSGNEALAELNGGALRDPRVEVVHGDAVRYLQDAADRFDVIVMDLPDPNDAQLARLYSLPTFRLARRRLRPGGALVTQATSPFYALEAFWCIAATMRAAFAEEHPGAAEATVTAYHAHVPSFGEWGWVMARTPGVALELPAALTEELRFLDDDALEVMFTFPTDLQEPEGLRVNHLTDAVLARYYTRGWRRWN